MNRAMLIRTTVLVIGLAVLWTSARAADTPTLKAKVTVNTEIVTIGDLFQNPGSLADTPLYRAPDLGHSGSVPANVVLDAARAAGLRQANASGLNSVRVHRNSLEVSSSEIEQTIKTELSKRFDIGDNEDIQITYTRPIEPLHAAPGAHIPLRVSSIATTAVTGRFEALLLVDQGSRTQRVRLRGRAIAVVRLAVLRRPMTRGEIVTKIDVVLKAFPRRRVRGAPLQSADGIIGMAVKRSMRAGSALTASDFTTPVLVSRGTAVTIEYRIGGLAITAIGKAMADGSKDQLITVLNERSKRSIQATVIGHNRVRVDGISKRIATLKRTIQ